MSRDIPSLVIGGFLGGATGGIANTLPDGLGTVLLVGVLIGGSGGALAVGLFGVVWNRTTARWGQ